MKLKENLVLLGMMGSGKSTIGLLISKKLNIKFVDVDNIIEKNMNMPIAEIFKVKGENFFRNLEEKITIKLLSSSNTVISLGGGSFINDKIRNEVINNNYSFWLSCSTSTIINRIKNNKKRPLASNLDDSKIRELITNRSKIYTKAQFKINCDKLTKKEIVNKIVKLYEYNKTKSKYN